MPERYRFLSNSGLKIIALAAMVLDHIAGVLLAEDYTVLFTFLGRQIGYYEILRLIGQIAFPIYAFLLVEGFQHTRNRRQYGIRLLAFALISEIPWNLAHAGTVFFSGQNIFFTLCLGYLGMCAIEYLRDSARKTAGVLALFALLLTSIIARADYGCKGFGFILFLYFFRTLPVYRAIIGPCFLSGHQLAGAAFVPIACYNGRRGFVNNRPLQLLFYTAYPVHLLILYFIRRALGGY